MGCGDLETVNASLSSVNFSFHYVIFLCFYDNNCQL